jgi:hypothetical protein
MTIEAHDENSSLFFSSRRFYVLEFLDVL